MIRQVDSKRAAAVTLAAAAMAFLLFMGIGMFYFLPMAPAIAVVKNTWAAYLVTFVAVPLVGVLFWRSPWWVRWACLGVLLGNLGILVYTLVAFGTGALNS